MPKSIYPSIIWFSIFLYLGLRPLIFKNLRGSILPPNFGSFNMYSKSENYIPNSKILKGIKNDLSEIDLTNLYFSKIIPNATYYLSEWDKELKDFVCNKKWNGGNDLIGGLIQYNNNSNIQFNKKDFKFTCDG